MDVDCTMTPRRRLGKWGLTGGLALLIAASGPAASSDDPNPFFNDMPWVLTASRLSQPTTGSPAPVTVIDRALIDASGYTEIYDLLRLVPGYQVADWPEGSPVVASHGLGDAYDRRIKVLIDGRNVNHPLWGDTRWDNLPLRVDDIERIEVVRGPNGAAYGVNAFQGVINLITRTAATENGQTVITRFGPGGFFDHGVRLNAKPGANIDWRLSASRRAMTNFETYHEPRSRAPFVRLHPVESMRRDVFNLSVRTLVETDELRLDLGGVAGNARRGSGDDYYIEYPRHTDEMRSVYLHGQWLRTLGPEASLSVRYAFLEDQDRSKWMVTADELPAPVLQDADMDARRHEVEIQINDRLGDRLTGMLGAGLRIESLRSQQFFSTNRELVARHSQLFGSLDWQATDRLRWSLGGTFESHDEAGTLFSPRLAAIWQLAPDASVRVSTGLAHRAPSLIESNAFETLRADGEVKRVSRTSFDDIDPEQMRFIELGYVAAYRSLGLHVDARAFRESYSGYIDDNSCIYIRPGLSTDEFDHTRPYCPRPVPGIFNPIKNDQKAFYFLNASDFVMTGAEFTLDWQRADWGRVRLTQAFIDIEGRGELSDPDIEKSAPASQTSLLVLKHLPDRWFASVSYYHNHPYYWLNSGDLIPNRDRFDVSVGRRFGKPGGERVVRLTALSVGGDYPDLHRDRYQHEPRVFLSVSATF